MFNLDYIPSYKSDTSVYSEADFIEEIQYWNIALVEAMVGLNVSFTVMENFVEFRWNMVDKPKVYLNNIASISLF